MRRWKVGAIVFLAVIACITLPLFVLHTVDNTSKKAALAQQQTAITAAQVASNCASLNELRHTLALLVLNGTKTLGKKGTAGYAYYHVHPDELKAAIRQSQFTARVTLAPKKCILKKKRE